MDRDLRNKIIHSLGELPSDGAHQVDHIVRVGKIAVDIGKAIEFERLDLIELVALSHEIGDRKLTPGLTVQKFYKNIPNIPMDLDRLQLIVDNLAWSKGQIKENLFTLDEISIIECVTDADKIEALGAIGISRCIIYSGKQHVPLFDYNKEARIPCSREDYLKESSASSINHMFEKLFLLPGQCRTEMGRNIALDRKKYMVDYLYQLYLETGIKFPIKGYQILHLDPRIIQIGNDITIEFNYSISTQKKKEILHRLNTDYQPDETYCSSTSDRFLIQLTNPEYLPSRQEILQLSLLYPSERYLEMFY